MERATSRSRKRIAPNYPIIGDPDLAVAKLYNMLPSNVSGNAARRTAADNQTARNAFVVGPDKRIKLTLVYPMTTGRNFDDVLRVLDSLQVPALHKVATPANWKPGTTTSSSPCSSVSDEGGQGRDLSARLEGTPALPAPRARIPSRESPTGQRGARLLRCPSSGSGRCSAVCLKLPDEILVQGVDLAAFDVEHPAVQTQLLLAQRLADRRVN